jgi:hypothetical protein
MGFIKLAVSFLLFCCGVERLANAADMYALSKARKPISPEDNTPIIHGGCGFSTYHIPTYHDYDKDDPSC